MPLTAAGITLGLSGSGRWLECVGALLVAGSGMLVGGLHILLAACGKAALASRTLFAVSGLSLITGIALASLYAVRFWYPSPMAQMARMLAFHGTLNALGFSALALCGWNLEKLPGAFSCAVELSPPPL